MSTLPQREASPFPGKAAQVLPPLPGHRLCSRSPISKRVGTGFSKVDPAAARASLASAVVRPCVCISNASDGHAYVPRVVMVIQTRNSVLQWDMSLLSTPLTQHLPRVRVGMSFQGHCGGRWLSRGAREPPQGSSDEGGPAQTLHPA